MNEQELLEIISALPEELRKNAFMFEPMRKHTTFRIGGKVDLLIKTGNSNQLTNAMNLLHSLSIPLIVIGSGSNLLATDEDIHAAIIVFETNDTEIDRKGNTLLASASCKLDACVESAMAWGLCGMEELSGIPGTAGAAVIGNVGAFGRMVSDIFAFADILTHDGKLIRIYKDEIEFEYRFSSIKRIAKAVVRVGFELAEGDCQAAKQRRMEILELRASKHPNPKVLPTAGSFFKNIQPPGATRRTSAGKLLDECGFKGANIGDAWVYSKHANILINLGKARAKDVLALAEQMQQAVMDRFGIRLEREVKILPDEV